ncbi:MAG: DUF421 domain-containing protein [Burkholderiaceae bacterium]|nr:DUF421 domain-containing protein [Burkholderiaceae bacterium]
MDWPSFTGLFRFVVSPIELIVRGTVMYWTLFVLFRFVLRRDAGSLAIADILLLVLIADAAQNAMAGGYETIAEGCVLVATIAAWNYLLDWSSYRFDAVRRFAEPDPLRLVRDGRILRANLRRELLTVDELEAKLREQGIDDLTEVAAAFMESDGQISVIRAVGGSELPRRPERSPRP